ncbi:hypothetical protein DB30_03551 [Enhygromyxa salina]|uniref:Uncharacterized protein n=1 Tax=Enhygromyxa salina TaxID=215803 RepID=A0A0C2A1J2_9BACT|nr:DUF4003 family protein [Enhygromyxa salina]KIG17238.1 hypothetical protein DB30_03551 [Enhygromyxa salina]
MPFRSHDAEQDEHLREPVARFFALDAALEPTRGMFGDRSAQRFAAASLVLVPGEPAQIATQLRETAKQFQQLMPWRVGFAPQLHLMFAVALVRHDDTPDALLDETKRVRKIMRALGLRWAPVYEFIAVLVMRTLGDGAPISDEQVQRMRDIYEAMKQHHWVLTGPEDFPACALLTTRAGTPQQLAQYAHDIYEGLRAGGRGRGDPLQTASNLLAMLASDHLPAPALSERFLALVSAFEHAGQKIAASEYDEVALLCFLSRPVPAIVETVAAYKQALGADIRWFEGDYAFGFATNLAFVQLVGGDPELGPIADFKSLLDMYSILLQNGGG